MITLHCAAATWYTHTQLLRALKTCAGDDNVHLSDDLIQFDQSESIHAKRPRENECKLAKGSQYLLN